MGILITIAEEFIAKFLPSCLKKKMEIFMKKLLSSVLVICMLLASLALTSCKKKMNENETMMKLGVGIHTSLEKATDADGELTGKGQAATTIAAVLLDENGKIVKCKLDCAENIVEYTSQGKFIPSDEFKTKYEMGADYGMKKLAGAAREWFEQADAFCGVAVGKTIDDISSLVAENGKGNTDVISAGCTIQVSEFVYALKNAIESAKEATASAQDDLSISVKTTLSGKDAAKDAEGYTQLDMAIRAAALSQSDKKETASGEVSETVKFTFNDKGISTLEIKK